MVLVWETIFSEHKDGFGLKNNFGLGKCWFGCEGGFGM